MCVFERERARDRVCVCVCVCVRVCEDEEEEEEEEEKEKEEGKKIVDGEKQQKRQTKTNKCITQMASCERVHETAIWRENGNNTQTHYRKTEQKTSKTTKKRRTKKSTNEKKELTHTHTHKKKKQYLDARQSHSQTLGEKRRLDGCDMPGVTDVRGRAPKARFF